MKKIGIFVLLLAPLLVAARPRYPYPDNSEKVWQNDVDLYLSNLATERTISSIRQSDAINLKLDFNAKGDGSTDDAAAVNAAISSASATGRAIYGPPGTYIFDSGIIAKSSVTIFGAGRGVTIFSLPQENISPMNYSLIENETNLYNFHIRDIQLRGNRGYQTSAFTSGASDGYAVAFVTGTISNVTFENLYVHEFGATGAVKNTSGGGIIIVPVGTDTTSSDIACRNNLFGNNDKVPGFYLDPQNGTTTGGGRNIYVTGNTFLGGGNNNAVYVLGGYGAAIAKRVYNVNISDNFFYTTENYDASIEINGINGFVVDNNLFHYTASGVANPCLIRSDVTNGSFSGNQIVSYNSETAKPSVALVAHDNGTYQENIAVVGNTFFLSAANTGILKVLKGSKRIRVSNNIFFSTTTTSAIAIDVGEATDVDISGNTFENITTPIRISEGTFPSTARIGIRDNRFFSCGGSGAAHIATTGGAISLTELDVEGNTVVSPKSTAGGAVFASISVAANTGNILRDNKVYGSLPTTDSVTPWAVVDNNIGYDRFASSCTVRSSPIATTASTAKTIASITLGIGDWDIRGSMGWRTQGTTTVFYAAINTTTDALPTGDALANFSAGQGYVAEEDQNISSAQDFTLTLPASRLQVTSGTTTIYLVQQTDNNNNAYGCIEARPVH